VLWNAEALLGRCNPFGCHLKQSPAKNDFTVRGCCFGEMQIQSDSMVPSLRLQNDSGLFSMDADRNFRVPKSRERLCAIEAVTEFLQGTSRPAGTFLLNASRRIAESEFSWRSFGNSPGSAFRNVPNHRRLKSKDALKNTHFNLFAIPMTRNTIHLQGREAMAKAVRNSSVAIVPPAFQMNMTWNVRERKKPSSYLSYGRDG